MRMFLGPFPGASSDYILSFYKLDPRRLGNGPIRFALNYILPWLKQKTENSAVVRGFNRLQLRSARWKPDTAGHNTFPHFSGTMLWCMLKLKVHTVRIHPSMFKPLLNIVQLAMRKTLKLKIFKKWSLLDPVWRRIRNGQLWVKSDWLVSLLFL